MTPTKEQLQEWKEKHGSFYELESEGKTAFIFDPSTSLIIMKALVEAMSKGSLEYVDCLLNNCWIDGDSEMKTDDQVKTGLIDKVKEIIDIPEYEVTYSDDKATITIEGKSLTVKLASRLDIKYAEDRNKKGKALDTQIHLLERIANKQEIDEWRKQPRLYLGLLLATDEVKAKKYVSIKKY